MHHPRYAAQPDSFRTALIGPLEAPQLTKNPGGPADNILCLRSRGASCTRADEQPHSKDLLRFGKALGEQGLVFVKPQGRAVDRAGLRDPDNGLEMAAGESRASAAAAEILLGRHQRVFTLIIGPRGAHDALKKGF